MRTALVTGATGGLGSIIARALDLRGIRTIIHYHRAEERARALAAAMKNSPYLIQADIGDFQAVEMMAREIEKVFGRIDIIINNAAITIDRPLIKYPESAWDEVIRTNLKGPFNVIRTFAPLMVSAKGGHIINISSLSGIKGRAGQAAYSASKAALIGLTLTLSMELSVYNIRVNAVVPGYLPVGMGEQAEAAMSEAKRQSVLGRLSDPEEVARQICCLIETEGITGQVFFFESRIGFGY